MAVPAREHAGEHLAAQLGGREQVEPHHLVEVVGVEVGQVRGDLDGGVVDQDVDRPVPALDPGHEGAQGRLLGEVARHRTPAHLAGDLVEGVAAARHDRDVGPGLRETHGQPAADVARGAR